LAYPLLRATVTEAPKSSADGVQQEQKKWANVEQQP
jgi:hypothetical protein